MDKTEEKFSFNEWLANQCDAEDTPRPSPNLAAMRKAQEFWHKHIADDLTFRSYRYVRGRYPQVTPYQWETVYGKDTAGMELRLWLEEFSSKCATNGVFAALRETH